MMKGKQTKLIIAVGLPCIAALGALAIEATFNAFSWQRVILAISLTMLLLTIIAIVQAKLGQLFAADEVSDLVERLESLVAQSEAKIPACFWCNARLARYEAKFSGDSITVVSPTLEHDVDDGIYVNAVAKNVSKGVSYSYVVPDRAMVRGRASKLLEAFKSNPALLRMVWVPEAIFDLLTFTHVVAYKTGAKFTLFMELPTGTREYWIEVDDVTANAIFSQIEELKHKYGNQIRGV